MCENDCGDARGNHIRRIPVVDGSGRCIDIVAQADLSLRADPSVAAEVLREVSRVAGR